jgi:hypothetical protein
MSQVLKRLGFGLVVASGWLVLTARPANAQGFTPSPSQNPAFRNGVQGGFGGTFRPGFTPPAFRQGASGGFSGQVARAPGSLGGPVFISPGATGSISGAASGYSNFGVGVPGYGYGQSYGSGYYAGPYGVSGYGYSGYGYPGYGYGSGYSGYYPSYGYGGFYP